MKKIEIIKNKIKESEPYLKEKFKVKRIGIFGSYLREEEKRGSDLDMLVEFYEPMGFFDFIRLENFLSKIIKTKVDLVMKNALKPRIKTQILKEAIYI